MLNRKEISRPS